MKKYLLLLLVIFAAVTGFYFIWSWMQLSVGERFIYPIDDAYIHLAIAKNFAESSSWSVNPGSFDSASSSILYTLLLTALIKIFGVWEYYPLVINIVFGFLTIYAVYKYLRDFYGASEMKWFAILFLPFTLIYVMVLIGMEHTIHLFLMVLAVYFIHQNVNSNFKKSDFLKLLVIVFFISIVRFESMFFTASLAFALFLRKDFIKGFSVLIIGFVAIVIFGLISIQHGGYFFPNSVVVKGSFPTEGNFISGVFKMLVDGIFLNPSFYKCLFFPFVLILLYILKKYRSKNILGFFKNETLIITIVATAILHSLFSVLKYRYENYLMISLLLIIVPIISEYFKSFRFSKFEFKAYQIFFVISFMGIIAISVYRFGFMHIPMKVSSKNISEQQIEMSRFLNTYYKGQKILANDIGAISYFGNVQLLDLAGLGSTATTKVLVDNKNNDQLTSDKNYREFLINYTRNNHYKIAIIYPEWFPGEIPKEWIPVASWKIFNNKACAREKVVLYALNPEEVSHLMESLKKFNLNKNAEQIIFPESKLTTLN